MSVFLITSHISVLVEALSSSHSSSLWTLNETTDISFCFSSSVAHSSSSLFSTLGFICCVFWGFNHTHTHTHTHTLLLFWTVSEVCLCTFQTCSLYIFLRWKNMLGVGVKGSLLCPSVSRGKTKSPSLFCFHCVASVLLPVTVREMFACVQKHFV